jgi:hypothetical protein
MSKTVEEQINVFLCNVRESVKAAYLRGYKNGLNDGNINDGTFAAKVKEAYNNGLNDAWECAKKIVTDTGLKYTELEEIFGCTSMNSLLTRFSASEAVARIKEYEGRQKKVDDKIHIGDEVYILDKNHKSIVTALLDGGNKANLLCMSGNYIVVETQKLHKTGRLYRIGDILKGLSEEHDDD